MRPRAGNSTPSRSSDAASSSNRTFIGIRSMTYPDLLFVPYGDTLDLLSVDDAMRVCEEVYHMLARGTVVHSKPPRFKLDVAEQFNNHGHVRPALLQEVPATGV